ncbi:MAG: hypothetical protein CL880_03250 [Dehalococcoidia bacterium]|nr:hypothetical protein [Dehalococcoidia bacterium]
MIGFRFRYILLVLLSTTISLFAFISCSNGAEIETSSNPTSMPASPVTDLTESTAQIDDTPKVVLDVLFNYLRAQSLLSAAMYKEAIGSYNVVLKVHPELYLAYHGRALAYYKEGMVERALEDFDQAIAIKPDYASALRNRGVVYANEGRLTEACSDLNKALGIYETRLSSGKVVFNQEKIKNDLMETTSQLRSCR